MKDESAQLTHYLKQSMSDLVDEKGQIESSKDIQEGHFEFVLFHLHYAIECLRGISKLIDCELTIPAGTVARSLFESSVRFLWSACVADGPGRLMALCALEDKKLANGLSELSSPRVAEFAQWLRADRIDYLELARTRDWTNVSVLTMIEEIESQLKDDKLIVPDTDLRQYYQTVYRILSQFTHSHVCVRPASLRQPFTDAHICVASILSANWIILGTSRFRISNERDRMLDRLRKGSAAIQILMSSLPAQDK